MSINAIEIALCQASMIPAATDGLREDADSGLGQFRIDESERVLTTSWDSRGLVDLGVRPKVVKVAWGSRTGSARWGLSRVRKLKSSPAKRFPSGLPLWAVPS